MKSKALSHSDSVIIIQVCSKISRATGKVLKNAECMWSSRDCICSNFYLTNHLVNVSLKRKTDNISIIIRRITTAERARAVGMLQQYVSITFPVCIGHRSLNTGVRNAWRPENDVSVWFIVNCDICQQETGICKHSRKKLLTCRIPAPCRSIPTALAPFSVRRTIMQNVVCFSFK